MIQGTGPSPEDILHFQSQRNITALFKSFLETLEDVARDHDEALDKLEESLPPEYRAHIGLADYLTEAKSAQLRKRVLERGNATIRALDEIIRSFDIKLK